MRVLTHAAVLLEKLARSTKECATIRGKWDAESIEDGTKAAYDDLVTTAKQLRQIKAIDGSQFKAHRELIHRIADDGFTVTPDEQELLFALSDILGKRKRVIKGVAGE